MNITNPQQQIEKPAGATQPAAEPAFFVMPEEYRHGATGKKMAEPAREVPKPAAPMAPPPPPRPTALPTAPGPKKGMPKHLRAMLIAGGILLLGLAVAGYLVLRSVEEPTVIPAERPTTTTRPPPEPEPEPEPETEPEPEPEPETEPESPFPTVQTSGTDTDSDGLTDLEERLVYGTNPRLPDTDSDGFLDGNEVFHRYNPAGTAPGMLVESGLAKPFTGPASDAAWYRMFYPSVWAASALTLDWGNATTFTATSGESIAVTALERTEGIAFSDWLVGQGEKDAFSAGTTKNGYPSLTSEDQLTVYVDGTLSGAGYAAKIEYVPGIKATIDYLQTFKMMVNSLEWL